MIPMLAVPVALIGTLAVMFALGYSINNLTLFGMVLAIGIVVDDAIVVVEAVEFHIARGLSPEDATRQAMSEVARAIIGVSLVLCAVFVPAAVIPGLTGQFFKQFAVTIAVSTLISAFNSLTLSPALCPLLLRSHHAPRDLLDKALFYLLGWWLFRGFNWVFDRGTIGLRCGRRLAHPADAHRAARVRRASGPHVPRLPQRSRRLHPATGPGLSRGERRIAGRIVAGTKREDDGEGRPDLP